MSSIFPKGQEGLNNFESNFHTGIDLNHHPPNDILITDQSLMEFAYGLQLAGSELSHMKNVAEKILRQVIQQIPNDIVEKVIISEPHLYSSGRNDSGFDLVVLVKRDENVETFTSKLKEKMNVFTSVGAGRLGEGHEQSGGEAIQPPTVHAGGSSGEQHGRVPHATSLHFEHDGVHVNVAIGNRYGSTESENRETIWRTIESLDKGDKLKKVHLDQFAIDLYESTTMFMYNQVAQETTSSEVNEKFFQGALRLARAWRQCSLSHRDIQFSPLDAWLVMLNAVNNEIHRSAIEKKEGAAGIGGAVTGVKKALKEAFTRKGAGQQSGVGLSMKNVFRDFLNQLYYLDNMNIQFTDFYPQSKVPDWIKTQRPLILDPVCPYRNTVYNLHKRVNEDIKKHAYECTKVLDDPNATLTKLFPVPTHKRRGA